MFGGADVGNVITVARVIQGRTYVVADTKAAVWTAVWKPFGEPQSITGGASLDARFPGQWFQVESGLSYNWHRQYDASTGRYAQPDPLGFVDGPGRFGYAGQSGIQLIDPAGLTIKLPGGGTVDIGVEVPNTSELNTSSGQSYRPDGNNDDNKRYLNAFIACMAKAQRIKKKMPLLYYFGKFCKPLQLSMYGTVAGVCWTKYFICTSKGHWDDVGDAIGGGF